MVVDGGIGGMEYSTVVDMTEEQPKIIRQGLGVVG
jgi:tRNA A37 threonylcarbamoyladenosine synthetase subunit TsaC/SUA5/YrdC